MLISSSANSRMASTAYLLIAFVAFYLLDRFSIFIEDDYYYRFKDFWCGDLSRRISSLGDIMSSQWTVYRFGNNGRFIVHSIVQFFCGIGGMELFRVCNSLMFALLCLFVARYALGRDRGSIAGRSMTAALLWFSIPLFGKTFLGGIAFSVNYLWTSVAVVFFLALHDRLALRNALRTTSVAACAGLFLFGAVCGSLQESFSVPVAGALFVYYIFNFSRFKGAVLWLVVGYWLGALFVVAAPGNFVRMAYDNGELHTGYLTAVFKRVFEVLVNMRATWAVIIATFALMVAKGRATRDFIAGNAVLYLTLAINFAFMSFVGMGGEHQLVCMELMSIILLLRLAFGFAGHAVHRYKYGITVVLVMLMGVTFVRVYGVRREVFEAHEQFLDVVRSGVPADGTVIDDSYDRVIHSHPWGRFAESYYYNYQKYVGCRYNRIGLSLMLTDGADPNLIKRVLPMPPADMVAMCVPENRAQLGIESYRLGDLPYYVIPLDGIVPRLALSLSLTYEKIPQPITRLKYLFSHVKSTTRIELPFDDYYSVESFDHDGRTYIVLQNLFINRFVLRSAEVHVVPESDEPVNIYRDRFIKHVKKTGAKL